MDANDSVTATSAPDLSSVPEGSRRLHSHLGGAVFGLAIAAFLVGPFYFLSPTTASFALIFLGVAFLGYALFVYEPTVSNRDESAVGNPIEFQKILFTRMDVIGSARFAAAERLELRTKSVNLVLSLLAAEVILVTVIDMVFDFQGPYDRQVQLSGLLGSIFVLVLSLYQFASHDEINSEKCLQNAMKISDLRRRLALIEHPDEENLGKIAEEYSGILKECGINHDRVDFIKAKIVNGQYKDGRMWRVFDNTWIMIRRVPPLAFVSWSVLFFVGMVTIRVLLVTDHLR